SGWKEEGGLRALEAGEPALHLLVQIGVTGDEARGARAAAPGVDRVAGGGTQCGMRGQSQVVVGRELQDAPAADLDFRIARRAEGAQRAMQPPAFQALELASQLRVQVLHAA